MLKRKKYPLPLFIKNILISENLFAEYQARPAYQQNDYIGWITRAKQATTQEKRLRQMLSELKKGGVYMNMKHAASAK